MAYIPVPDMASQLSPNISFKSEGDRAAVIGIMQAEYSEVQKFNQAPAIKALQFADKLEKMAKKKPEPNVTTASPHFEHRVLSEAEKQGLINDHMENSKKHNMEAKNKHKVQRDGKGKTVERTPHYIDTSKSLYQPPDMVATGQVTNIVQVYAEKHGPAQGHWAVDAFGKPVYRNGRRLWIKGQHNYNRQRDPRNPDEAILGTRLMNNNIELKPIKELSGELQKEIDTSPDARIGSYKRTMRVFDRASQNSIVDDAVKEAVKILRAKFGNSTAYPNSAQGGENPESHK